MTFGEIYDTICFNVWGNSAAPERAVEILRRIISRVHRNIQQDYNYWFMHTWTTIETSPGVASYPLTNDYKEMISCVYKVHDEDYFTPPLKPVTSEYAHSNFWPRKDSAEYARFYEITDRAITLYPFPSERRTLHIVYYGMLPAPENFTDASDQLSQAGGGAIIQLASAEIFKIQKEFDSMRVYLQDAGREIEYLKEEDRRRVQNQLYEVLYQEF